jgi:hypothetical protein
MITFEVTQFILMSRLFLFVGLLLIGITACTNKTVYFSEVIRNESDSDMVVYFHDTGDTTNMITYAVDSVIIPAKTEAVIFERGTTGLTSQFNPCKIYADSLSAQVAVGIVTKDLNDTTNFDFSNVSSSKKEGKKCECRLLIKNTDIQ